MLMQATVGGASLFLLVNIVDAEPSKRPGQPLADHDGAQILAGHAADGDDSAEAQETQLLGREVDQPGPPDEAAHCPHRRRRDRQLDPTGPAAGRSTRPTLVPSTYSSRARPARPRPSRRSDRPWP